MSVCAWNSDQQTFMVVLAVALLLLTIKACEFSQSIKDGLRPDKK